MEIKIESQDGRSVYESGVQTIKELIYSEELKAGTQLPSIRAFSNSNEISAATTQRIYDKLEEEGFIAKIPGKGCFVSEQPICTTKESGAVTVFWSYAHKDDENTHGAISLLLENICREYEVQTGDSLSVFVDTDIKWGSDWKKAITDAVCQTTFFIPVLTPTYLKRPNCLNELRNAKHLFEEAGIEKGIYPIHFIDITRALDTFPNDELANLIHRIQGFLLYENDARNPKSIKYQAAIEKIVHELILIDDEQREGQGSIARRVSRSEPFDQGGILDNLAKFEEESGKQIAVLSEIESDFSLVGKLASNKSLELEHLSQDQSFAKRLAITKELAKELKEPAARINSNCGKFTSGVAEIGRGVWAYVDFVKTVNPESRSQEFETTILETADSAHQAFSQVNSFDKSLQTIEKLSRELRTPIGEIRSGIECLLSTDQSFTTWAKWIDELD